MPGRSADRHVTGWAGWCLRLAGASGIVNGLGFGGFTIPAMVSIGQGRGILYTFGNPTYGNGPFDRIGIPTSVPLLAGFLAACLVQVLGGVLLLVPRRSGIAVTFAGLLLGAPFWWGFDLPLAWLNAAMVVGFLMLALLVLAWGARRATNPEPGTPGAARPDQYRPAAPDKRVPGQQRQPLRNPPVNQP